MVGRGGPLHGASRRPLTYGIAAALLATGSVTAFVLSRGINTRRTVLAQQAGGITSSPDGVNGRGRPSRRECGAVDHRAVAPRAITLRRKRRSASAYAVVADLYPETGHAHAVGITGPPGRSASRVSSRR